MIEFDDRTTIIFFSLLDSVILMEYFLFVRALLCRLPVIAKSSLPIACKSACQACTRDPKGSEQIQWPVVHFLKGSDNVKGFHNIPL